MKKKTAAENLFNIFFFAFVLKWAVKMTTKDIVTTEHVPNTVKPNQTRN